MRSTFICSRNDIISNTGVLAAALGVRVFESKWPDIAVGYAIAILFFASALPIFIEAVKDLRANKANV
jgi:Co/Zn/Cd efflux system component